MKTISKDFNSKAAWRAWRHDGVGGSDVAKLFNASRYGDRADLLVEKLKPEAPEIDLWGPIQVAAQVTEQEARNALSEHLGHPIEPYNLEDTTNPELRVSLDGYNKKEGILLEHKMMGKDRRESAEAWLKAHEHFMEGIKEGSPIRELAYQIALQGALTRPKFVYLIISDYKTKAMKVYRNKYDKKHEKIGEKVKKKVIEFWKVVDKCRRQAYTTTL